MGYFSSLHIDMMTAQDFEETFDLNAKEMDDEFEIEYLVHQTRASMEGFTPLTKEQFYAAARAAIAKIDALMPQLAQSHHVDSE